jgi:pimeloyl-ACP methyl ester carboxylesterase
MKSEFFKIWRKEIFGKMRIKYYRVVTEDKREIVLTRIKRERAGGGYPVLCIPGMGQNRFSWIAPCSEFAEWFASRGIDVWILEPRGRGLSKLRKERYDWSIDELILYDLKSAIEKVLKETGRKKVFLVGHSLGGCMTYCSLSLYGKNIAGFATLGSPMKYRFLSTGWFIKLGALYNNAISILGKTPLEFLVYFPFPLLGKAGILGLPIMNTFLENFIPLHPWHRKNVKKIRLIRSIIKGFERESPKLVAHFLRWAKEGRFTSYDRKFDWTDGFLKAKIPGLFIAGDRDRLAPPSAVKYAYDAYGANQKKFVLLNKREHGTHWGHLDLTMGKNCSDFLFPIIFDWMKSVAEGKA